MVPLAVHGRGPVPSASFRRGCPNLLPTSDSFQGLRLFYPVGTVPAQAGHLLAGASGAQKNSSPFPGPRWHRMSPRGITRENGRRRVMFTAFPRGAPRLC